MKSKLKYVLSFVFITGLVLAMYNNCGKVNFGAANVVSKADEDNGGLGGVDDGGNVVDCNVTPDDASCPHDDPSLPNMYVDGQASVIEGNNFILSLSLTEASTSDISFNLVTSDGSAVSPDDYAAVSLTVVIPAGSLNISLTITTVDDELDENSSEYFLINLSNAANVNLSSAEFVASILDNDETAGDPPPPDVPEFVDDPGNPPDMDKYACDGGKYLLCHVQGDPLGNTLCLPPSSISSHESGHTNEGLMEGFENNDAQYPIKDYFGSCRHTVVGQ